MEIEPGFLIFQNLPRSFYRMVANPKSVYRHISVDLRLHSNSKDPEETVCLRSTETAQFRTRWFDERKSTFGSISILCVRMRSRASWPSISFFFAFEEERTLSCSGLYHARCSWSWAGKKICWGERARRAENVRLGATDVFISHELQNKILDKRFCDNLLPLLFPVGRPDFQIMGTSGKKSCTTLLCNFSTKAP